MIKQTFILSIASCTILCAAPVTTEYILEQVEISKPQTVTRESNTTKISGFLFRGNTSVKNQQLQAVIYHYVNRQLTAKEILMAADEITRYYHKKGFKNTRAYVYKSDVHDEAVTITLRTKNHDVIAKDPALLKKSDLFSVTQTIIPPTPINTTEIQVIEPIKPEDIIRVDVNATGEMAPDVTSRYLEAKEHYGSKSFGKSYEILSSIYMDALDNPELNFYLGRSAYETGEFPIAIAAFERVQALDPNNVRNQLELARTQYYLRLFPEAKEGFKKVLQNPGLPENVRLNVEYYLAAIAKEEQRSFVFVALKGGILYDSNVNYASIDSTYTLPFLGTYNSPKRISDIAHEETFSLVHLKDIGAKDGFIVRNQLNVYNRQYDKEDAYNLRVYSYNPALVYNTKGSSYELIGGVDRLFVGGKVFSMGYSLEPKWTYNYLPALRQTLSLKMNQKKYLQSDNSGLDSHGIEGSAGLEYYISGSSSLRGDMVLSSQVKNSGDRVDVDYNDIGANILYTKQLLPTTIVQANAAYKQRAYSDYSTLFQSYRNDESTSGYLNLIQRLNSAVSLEAMGSYSRTNSTISIYSHDKYTLSLGVSARF